MTQREGSADDGAPPAPPPTTTPPATPPPMARDPGAPALDAETQPITRAALRAERQAQQQRVRTPPAAAEPGGPVVAWTVLSAVALAVLVALGGLAGALPTALAVGFTALVLVGGWAALTDTPSPRVATGILAAGVLATTAAAALTHTEPFLVWEPVAAAGTVIAVLLHQVLRSGSRDRLTQGAASSIAAVALTASGSALVALPHYPRGGSWLCAALTGLAVSVLPQLLTQLAPLHGRPGLALLAAVAAGAVGGAVAGLVAGLAPLPAAASGLLAGGIAHAALRVLLALPGARSALAALSAGAASVLVVGVVVYLTTRLYAG